MFARILAVLGFIATLILTTTPLTAFAQQPILIDNFETPTPLKTGQISVDKAVVSKSIPGIDTIEMPDPHSVVASVTGGYR